MKQVFPFFLCLSLLLLVTSSVRAGQALYVNGAGDPLLWDNSTSDPIEIHPESGSCGQYSNSEMMTLIENNLEEWSDNLYVDIAFEITEGELGSVDGDNYMDYLAGVIDYTNSNQDSENVQDGLNPVIFDNDGEIIDYATGENNGRYMILGFANPAGFSLNAAGNDYEYIVDGQAVFNCYCLEDESGDPANDDCSTVSSTPIVFTTDDLDFTMVHEMGHFINLDHTQVNEDLYNDGDDDNDADIPTMYPVSVNAAEQKTPSQDDIVALASIYPTSKFYAAGSSSSHFCKVTGTLLDRFGTELRCADVQAIADDTADNVSFTSGSYAVASDDDGDGYTDGSGECESGCGDFVLYLEPGVEYAIKVASINSSFIGGSSIGACGTSQLTTCTTSIIEDCTDSDDDTSCTACVANETLSKNDASENISATILSDCSAGSTVALGDITTQSVSAVTGNDGDGGGDGGGTSSTSTGCSLNNAVFSNLNAMGGIFVLFFSMFFTALIRRFKK